MLVELNKQDLINLVRGIEPTHKQMNDPRIAKNGSYFGGFNDRWEWHSYPFSDLNEEQIFDIYLYLKKTKYD